jgi:hypothetical protein
MGGACSIHGKCDKYVYTKFCCENLKEETTWLADRHILKGNIKMDHKEVNVDWINLTNDRRISGRWL